MDTNLATKQFRLNQWVGIIKDCRLSGLRVDDYCRQHGISRDAYYYWLRKIKAAALLQAGFVELPEPKKVSAPTQPFVPQMMLKAGENELYINSDTPSELIIKILRVTRNA